MMKIGVVAKQLKLSIDTLRYYEKFGLLTHVARDTGGMRDYSQHDLSRLRFIQRAQKMNFCLAEIKDLLQMRENPQAAKDTIRQTTVNKLTQINERIAELSLLRNELQLLVNLCQGSEHGCPILENMEK